MPKQVNRYPGISPVTTKSGQRRWKAVVEVGHGADRKQAVRRFTSQEEARAWQAETRTKHRRGELLEPSRMLLSEWAGEWLAMKARRVRPMSVIKYRQHLAHITAELGTLPLSRITPSSIERAYANLDAKLSPYSVRSIHVTLSSVLKSAVRDGLIVANPCARVDAPGGAPAARTAWDIATTRTFLSAVVDDPWADAWWLMLETWIRSGELRALRWSDIDLAGQTVTIRRTATLGADGKPTTGPPKTATSARTIPLSETMVSRLKARRKAQQIEALELGAGWDDDRLAFPAMRGGMIHSRVLNGALEAACTRAGVPYIGPHGLRHTGASLAHAANVPVKTMSDRLGHASAAITMNVYTHSDDDQQRSATGTMGDLLKQY
jgi:integrase